MSQVRVCVCVEPESGSESICDASASPQTTHMRQVNQHDPNLMLAFGLCYIIPRHDVTLRKVTPGPNAWITHITPYPFAEPEGTQPLL